MSSLIDVIFPLRGARTPIDDGCVLARGRKRLHTFAETVPPPEPRRVRNEDLATAFLPPQRLRRALERMLAIETPVLVEWDTGFEAAAGSSPDHIPMMDWTGALFLPRGGELTAMPIAGGTCQCCGAEMAMDVGGTMVIDAATLKGLRAGSDSLAALAKRARFDLSVGLFAEVDQPGIEQSRRQAAIDMIPKSLWTIAFAALNAEDAARGRRSLAGLM